MMKRVLSTSAIECNDLARTLELKGASVLLIDCRSFMDFNHCHIINAHNVHFPPIVKRRSGGSVRLERHVLRCPRTRSRLQAGHFSLVVVYDHNSSTLNDLPEDSIMNLVIRCLDSEDRIHNLRFLEGKIYFINLSRKWRFCKKWYGLECGRFKNSRINCRFRDKQFECLQHFV